MTPVTPAFAGHIPKALVKKYPNVKYYNQTWNGFPATYLLDANEALFQQIGSTFIEEYSKEFGTDHLYNCDTFNEMTPSSSDPGNRKFRTEILLSSEKETRNQCAT